MVSANNAGQSVLTNGRSRLVCVERDDMIYSQSYFRLQLDFAARVQQLSGQAPLEVLPAFTSFYKNFVRQGLRLAIDESTSAIQSEELLPAIYKFYLASATQDYRRGRPFGCFWCEHDERAHAIRLHFTNKDPGTPGALSSERQLQRLLELRQMFEHVRESHPNATSVMGFSWLYNIEPYRRLFPEPYVASARAIFNWFESGAIWGQFLNSAGQLRQGSVAQFRRALSDVASLEDLDRCFEYKVLAPTADIGHFFRFYGVESYPSQRQMADGSVEVALEDGPAQAR